MITRTRLARLLAAPLLGALVLGAAPTTDRVDDDEAVEVSISKLTSIEYTPGGDLPEEVQELDGKRISIDGYMALGTLEGIENFELVPEPCECGRSKVQHFIDVKLKNGLTTYKPGRITLTGTFDCGEKEEDGFVVSLYRLEIESLD